jgi:O-antigen/teichoic acid export membrane protein
MRSAVQVGIAVANVALNLALIPSMGYWGAVVASLLSDGLLAIMMWATVLVKLRTRSI